MKIDLRSFIKENGEDSCEKIKRRITRYGIQVVCNKEDELDNSSDEDQIVQAAMREILECEDVKKISSKYGIVITCSEEEDVHSVDGSE